MQASIKDMRWKDRRLCQVLYSLRRVRDTDVAWVLEDRILLTVCFLRRDKRELEEEETVAISIQEDQSEQTC
jgi:hypothetical protein